MTHILAVALGGAIGSVLRYGASRAFARSAGSFPWETLLVNVVGCVLLGLFLGLTQSRLQVSSQVHALLSVGLLGGFTTFSTFSHQTVALWQAERFALAGGNILLNVAVGLIAAWLGWQLGRVV